MAVKYLRSGAAGTGTGADWTNAFTTLTLALAGVAAGDTIYVANDHAETSATALTFVSPGTATLPVLIICVNTHVAVPPTAIGTGGTITTTAAVNINFSTGFAYVYGVSFIAGSGASSTADIAQNIAGASGWKWDNCKFILASTGTASRMRFGAASASSAHYWSELINTTLKFAATAQGIFNGQSVFIWRNTATAVDAGGTIPTTLFLPGTSTAARIEVSNVDLSALGSGKNLVLASATGSAAFYFRSCKLGASVSVISGAIVGWGAINVFLENCDSGNTNYRMEHYKYPGSVKNETTHVRASGGASDGVTPISHNLTTLTTPTLFDPLEGPWMTIWNDTTGSSKTVTVELCTENVSLFDDDCWIEVEYPGSSATPQGTFLSSRKADVFATHGALTTSLVTWSGFTIPTPQKIVSASFTPQLKGPIRVRVCVAKVSATVYVDPLITVT